MRLRISVEDQKAAFEQVLATAGPSRSYFILTLLSTIIASYGLISDSTATVIGAMIVAPLMGPILGLAMGAVREDSKLTTASLLAEAAGVALCVATAGAVALLVSPSSIDYANREIAGRIHPTLYDMAVGFAAGLAGAYATINTRISASIAGVAIAVALVPPLSVSGLCAVGALHGAPLWAPAVSAFLLFFANFLTIEIAAVTVFFLAGLRPDAGYLRGRAIVRHFGVMALLLLAVGAFLSHQLSRLLAERSMTAQAREVIRRDLAQIPGASIDRVLVNSSNEVLDVRLQALSPQEISPAMVQRMQADISKSLGISTRLTVRTVSSVYVTAEGKLFEPAVNESPDPRQARAQKIESALRRAIEAFPEADVVNFQQGSASDARQIFVTVRTPYVFDRNRVSALQARTNQLLAADQLPASVLVVRSILSRDATADGYLEPTPVGAVEQRHQRLLATVRTVLSDATREEGASLIDATISEPLPAISVDSASPEAAPSASPPSASTPFPDGRSSPSPTAAVRPDGPSSPSPGPSESAPRARALVTAVVQSPTLLDASVVARWQASLSFALDMPVSLTVENRVGSTITAP